MITVGIIDSGLTESIAREVSVETRDFSGSATTWDTLGHGTVISQVIAAAQPDRILMAKVFDTQLSCPSKAVIDALAWLSDLNTDVINMSFGMRRADPALASAVSHYISGGGVVIASSPAQGDSVYPAGFDGVIRATGDARATPNTWVWLNSRQADFGAYVGERSHGVVGASVGCAWMTHHWIRTLREHPRCPIAATKQRLIDTAVARGPECFPRPAPHA